MTVKGCYLVNGRKEKQQINSPYIYLPRHLIHTVRAASTRANMGTPLVIVVYIIIIYANA